MGPGAMSKGLHESDTSPDMQGNMLQAANYNGG